MSRSGDSSAGQIPKLLRHLSRNNGWKFLGPTFWANKTTEGRVPVRIAKKLFVPCNFQEMQVSEGRERPSLTQTRHYCYVCADIVKGYEHPPDRTYVTPTNYDGKNSMRLLRLRIKPVHSALWKRKPSFTTFRGKICA